MIKLKFQILEYIPFYIDESFEKPISVNVWDDESIVVEVNKLSSEYLVTNCFKCKL
jgi:hypothetical protein